MEERSRRAPADQETLAEKSGREQFSYALSRWEADRAEAVKWIVKAAERGYPPAQLRLGQLYEAGEGVGRNPRLAALWYRFAAEQELGEAQYRLAQCYSAGRGVKGDMDAARYWLSKAAENGYEV